MTNSDDLYGMELDRRMAAERALTAVIEVVEAYESCGPKQQSTRDVLAAVRAALEGFRPCGDARSVEMERKAYQAERRAEEAEFHVEQLRDARDSAERRIERAERLLDGWEQDGPDDPVVRLIIQRVRETLNHPKPESAADGCLLDKASCDPLANGCDGECEIEWRSYPCTRSNHAECGGVAWQPDITCECKCHSEASLPPAGGVS